MKSKHMPSLTKFVNPILDSLRCIRPVLGVLMCLGAIPGSGHGQSCFSPPTDFVSWWAGDGDSNDSVGNNPGTWVNGLGFAPGLVDQALNFDGTNDYFAVPASSSLDVAS